MIIKKYKAQTEKDAILLAKEDLGPDAIVMNVKTIKPKGLARLFKKTKVELTAAIDDNIARYDEKTFEKSSDKKSDKKADKKADSKADKKADKKSDKAEEAKTEASKTEKSNLFGEAFSAGSSEYSPEAKNAIEEKINNIAKLLEQQITAERAQAKERGESLVGGGSAKSDTASKDKEEAKEKTEEKPEEKPADEGDRVTELIRMKLKENEVSDEHINEILSEALKKGGKQQIDNTLSSVYQKIVLKLGTIEPIKPSEKKPKVLFFAGNTGVGKTTTIAKLASNLKLKDKLKIAIFSVDTYRIAAIDQIKTYASILGVPFEVIYAPEDMVRNIKRYNDLDIILVDTAGRSHKNDEQKKDLSAILTSAEGYESEVFLVLSATVKYTDLLSITKAYDEICDYRLIFTKLDETSGEGAILNLKLDTGKSLSYITWGQNVPDDIGLVDAQVIAKKLLGGA
ncbi:MAG: flagellar biosynthesis protein FlhF [Lachnospiraceae bacterium]|nr:flagellar biosynthesis protein FlhF [Lachnospiraceae bacterium]